ncbi:hypothetical protein DRN67_03910 [Candidatus Micrarchaeota archaeon]|nr:MAG: hypothetical protein DRN67_03910 [Candidatus Micrarchaeota archaeon]
MGLLDLFGKKNVGDALTSKLPYALKMRFSPIRLSIKQKTPIDLIIDLENIRDEEALLTSIVVQVPKALGLDSMGLNQMREIRLGYLKPHKRKELHIEIHATARTKQKTYPVHVTAFSHYRDYSHVLNSEKKKLELRVVG